MKPKSATVIRLAVITGLALVIRLGIFSWVQMEAPGNVVRPDTLSYERPAKALLSQGQFLSNDLPGAQPEVKRTPGYPLMIAAVYGVVGPRRGAVVALQILLSCATVALAWFIARRVWQSEFAASIAGALIAIDVPSILSSQLMLTETLFTFLLMMAVAQSMFAVKGDKPHPMVMLAVSILIVAATFVRPVTYYFIVPLAAWAVWLCIHHKTSARSFALVLIAIAIPWLAGIGGLASAQSCADRQHGILAY